MKLRNYLARTLTAIFFALLLSTPKGFSAGTADCLLREKEIESRGGVLAASSRTLPVKISEVSFSTDLGFISQAKFKGSYPQFNASWVPFSEWIRMDPQYPEQMHMTLAERKGKKSGREVLKFASGNVGLVPQKRKALDAVSHVVLKEIVKFMQENNPKEFAEYYSYNEATGDLVSRITGEQYNVLNPNLHPLDIAGRIVQEDLAVIMQDPEGNYRLMGGFLAHPSGWRLSNFMGWTVREIHEQSAGLNSKFAGAIDMALTAYHVGTQIVPRMQMRNNWFLVYDRKLKRGDQEAPEAATPTTLENVNERVFLRMERETMRAFTAPGVKDRFILFTIKPHVYELSTIAGHPKTEDLILGVFDVSDGAPDYDSILASQYLYNRLPQETQLRIDQALQKKWEVDLHSY